MRLKYDENEISSVINRKRGPAALLLAGLVLAACSDQKAADVPAREGDDRARAGLRAHSFLFGVISPRIESTLGFRVPGKIMERYVNVGDQVTAGQKIARLDEKDLKLAENSARAAVAAAKSRVAVAKDALGRANFLLPNGLIAKAAVDQRQLELDSAKSSFDAAEDQLNQAVNATSYAVLLADKDGIVTSVRAEPGQVVAAGQAVITLAHTSDIEVLAAVPEQEIVRLKPGYGASIALWSAPSVTSEGKIREIAGSADAASRTYAVRVTIGNPVPEMRIGMTASVLFKIRQETPISLLPLSALTERNGKTVAFVVDKDTQTVRQREVEAQGVSEDGARIGSGFAPGEIVVTGGVQFLQDGMRVRLAKEVLTAAIDTQVTAKR